MARRPWHKANPDFLARVREQVNAAYPELRFEVRGEKVQLFGRFRLVERANEIDSYEIEVVLPPDFPNGIPCVFEVGGRIPRDADHHMYSDGRACLFAPGERWRHWPRGATLVDFMHGPVRSYFIGQAIYEQTREWPFGYRRHGGMGIFDAYGEMLRTQELPIIVRYLEVLAREKLRPKSPCPCGSGTPIHSCHMRKIAHLRSKISRREAHEALAIIVQAVRTAEHSLAVREKGL